MPCYMLLEHHLAWWQASTWNKEGFLAGAACPQRWVYQRMHLQEHCAQRTSGGASSLDHAHEKSQTQTDRTQTNMSLYPLINNNGAYRCWASCPHQYYTPLVLKGPFPLPPTHRRRLQIAVAVGGESCVCVTVQQWPVCGGEPFSTMPQAPLEKALHQSHAGSDGNCVLSP